MSKIADDLPTKAKGVPAAAPRTLCRRVVLAIILMFGVLALFAVTDLSSAQNRQAESTPPRSMATDGLVFPSADWAIAAPESQGLDSSELDANLNGIAYAGNVAVIRNGYLIKTKGRVDDSRINIYSATKSITALVFASLLQQGKVAYDEVLPRSDYPAAPHASFRHFLTMTSDYDLTPHQPGAHYAYNNSAIRFYGEYMRLKFFPAETAAGVVKATIFDAIGAQDEITVSPDPGVKGTPWAGGQKISARDLARAGLLVLAKGRWENRQIIPAEFTEALFVNQIPQSATMSVSPGTVESGPKVVCFLFQHPLDARKSHEV